MINREYYKDDILDITCIENKCNFKNDCRIIKHFYEKGRADAIRSFAKWLVNKGVFIGNEEITDNGELYVLAYEKEHK